MSELKLVKVKGCNEIEVHDTELGEDFMIEENDFGIIKRSLCCDIDTLSGIKLLEIDGEVKLVIKYKDVKWPTEKIEKYIDLFHKKKFPYTYINGELVNVLPIEDIVEYAGDIHIYTTNGKEITHLTKGAYFEDGVCDFDIKFKKDNFVVVFGTNFYDSITLTKYVYSYNGKLLSQIEKKVDIESLVKNEINDDDSELKQ